MYLGIDYGRKRIGLALGEIIPKPFGILENKGIKENLSAITEICNKNDVATIVLGLPKHTDGTKGELASEILDFGTMLSDFSGRKVEYEDEQYSSVEVERVINMDLALPARKRKKKREQLDSIAAALILSQYIESKGRKDN